MTNINVPLRIFLFPSMYNELLHYFSIKHPIGKLPEINLMLGFLKVKL